MSSKVAGIFQNKAYKATPLAHWKPGDGFQVPAETPHAGGKNGAEMVPSNRLRSRVMVVVSLGQPRQAGIVSPATLDCALEVGPTRVATSPCRAKQDRLRNSR